MRLLKKLNFIIERDIIVNFWFIYIFIKIYFDKKIEVVYVVKV